jgi:hypothetical protein
MMAQLIMAGQGTTIESPYFKYIPVKAFALEPLDQGIFDLDGEVGIQHSAIIPDPLITSSSNSVLICRQTKVHE